MSENIIALREELESHSEKKYQQFMLKLVPGVNNIIGVRIPTIRKIAKRIAKDAPITFLDHAQSKYFEEDMLQALVITELKDIDIALKEAERFIPKINNWSVCDSFCAGMKLAKKHQELVWDFMKPYWKSTQAYDIRFAVVMMNFHYVNEKYLQELFKIFDSISHGDYYVKMAVAWAISTCFVKFPEETMIYLKNNKLGDETYNKALQKIRESLKVDKKMKGVIKAMKR